MSSPLCISNSDSEQSSSFSPSVSHSPSPSSSPSISPYSSYSSSSSTSPSFLGLSFDFDKQKSKDGFFIIPIDKNAQREESECFKDVVFHDELGFEFPEELKFELLAIKNRTPAKMLKRDSNWLRYFHDVFAEKKIPTKIRLSSPDFIDPSLSDIEKNFEILGREVEELYSQNLLQFNFQEPALKDLSNIGFPSCCRSVFWMEALGVKVKQSQNPNLYKQHLESGADKSSSDQIDLDLDRTFPDHPFFRSTEGKTHLRNILIAFASYNPKVGYCQSLNFICAMLLLVLKNEEYTFWALVYMLEFHFPNYHSKSLLNVQVDQQVLEQLIETRLPLLCSHFKHNNVQLNLLTVKWFLCFLCTTLPAQTALLVWDRIVVGGSAKMFEACLALLRINELSLLHATNNSEIMSTIQDPRFGCIDPHFFIKTVVEVLTPVETQEVERLRRQLYFSLNKQIQIHTREVEITKLQNTTHFEKKKLEKLRAEFEVVIQRLSRERGCKVEALALPHFHRLFTHLFPDWNDALFPIPRIFQVFVNYSEKNSRHQQPLASIHQLDFKALILGLSIICKGSNEEKTKFIFDMYDVNGSGHLESEELTSIYNSLYGVYYNCERKLDQEAVEGTLLGTAVLLNLQINPKALSLHSFTSLCRLPPLDRLLDSFHSNTRHSRFPFLKSSIHLS